MRAETVAQFAVVLRWGHVPLFFMIVSVVGFIMFYFRTGQLWLAWTVIGLRLLVLIINFLTKPSFNYRAITGLQKFHMLGETVSVPVGVQSPWARLGEGIAVHAAALVQQHHFLQPADRSGVVIKLEGRRLFKSVQLIESQLQTRDFLRPPGFSAADISVGYSVDLAQRFLPLDRLPAITRYYNRLRSRPAFAASLPKDWQRPLTWMPETGDRS